MPGEGDAEGRQEAARGGLVAGAECAERCAEEGRDRALDLVLGGVVSMDDGRRVLGIAYTDITNVDSFFVDGAYLGRGDGRIRGRGRQTEREGASERRSLAMTRGAPRGRAAFHQNRPTTSFIDDS